MKIPALDTRITVLVDCTDKFSLHNELGWEVHENFIVMRCSPITAQSAIYEAITKLTESDRGKEVLVLGSQQEVMALCCVLANSLVENPVPEIPVVNLSEVKVWEVWDNENILISNEAGLVESSSYDESMKPIVSDWMKIQSANAPKEDEAEVIQYTEEVPEEDRKTLQEVLAERKERAEEVKQRAEEVKQRAEESKTNSDGLGSIQATEDTGRDI